MATLQKFKMLATQCAAVSNSPTRSPTTSPIIHLRRRKTLKMLLTRRLPGFLDRRGGTDDVNSSEDEKDDCVTRRKLKDLFVSPAVVDDENSRGDAVRRWSDECAIIGRRSGGGGGGGRGFRFLTGTLRQRLLRRAWRPVLVTIPE